MSAIYEVTLRVDSEVLEDFKSWLTPHLRHVVEAGGFFSATVFKELRSDGAHVFVCHYVASSREVIERYISEKSAPLRQDGLNRFGTRFRAERRILEAMT